MTEEASLQHWVGHESCPINEAFPEHLFSTENLENSTQRLRFTLASLHCFIDAAPSHVYSGYMSVILAELNLVSLYTRQRIFSMECCRVPIYGNTLRGICRQCGTERQLRINPDVVGEIADETAAIHSSNSPKSTGNANDAHSSQSSRSKGKMLWSEEAWTNLLGRTPEEVAEWVGQGRVGLLQALEHRLEYMRIIMMVGWTGEYGGGRLAVLKIVQ